MTSHHSIRRQRLLFVSLTVVRLFSKYLADDCPRKMLRRSFFRGHDAETKSSLYAFS